MNLEAPRVMSAEADACFRRLATEAGLDSHDQWVGGYVDYEWSHTRFFYQRPDFDIHGASMLELGCNVGATSIVLAALGARVTAVDVDARLVDVARANAERYGVDDRTAFVHVPDPRRLPFPPASFDAICCNSVLEYVRADWLGNMVSDLDRVLKCGGLLFVGSTSNRLWLREVHSRRWLVNYLPHRLDAVLLGGRERQRGVFPWKSRRRFADTRIST